MVQMSASRQMVCSHIIICDSRKNQSIAQKTKFEKSMKINRLNPSGAVSYNERDEKTI